MSDPRKKDTLLGMPYVIMPDEAFRCSHCDTLKQQSYAAKKEAREWEQVAAMFKSERDELKQQRDDLLKAAKAVVTSDMKGDIGLEVQAFNDDWDRLLDAIARAEGE